MRLLRAYAKGHTHSRATNGSLPWVGENLDAESGVWLARDLMYQGAGSPPMKCAACKSDPRARRAQSPFRVSACSSFLS